MPIFRMPNMKKTIVMSALAVALSGVAAQAQKIAVLDMQATILATPDGKKAALDIDAKFAPRKVELQQIQKDLTDKQDKLSKGGATMSPAAVKSAQAEIDLLTTTLKRKQEDAQQDLQDEENKQLGAIVPKLQQVINAYAALNQISVVVDSSANPNNLIYAESSLNIMGPVLAAYEKATAPVAGAAAAPKATAPASAAPKTPATTTPRPPASPGTAPKPPAPGK